MMGLSPRFAKLRAAVMAVGAVVMVGGAGLGILGLTGWSDERPLLLAGLGLLSVATGAALMVGVLLAIKVESNTFRLYNQFLDMHELAKKQCELLGHIAENSALSDDAKTLANRLQEVDALRAAIRADCRDGAWDAALYLVDEMQRRFGYADEAVALRKEVVEARTGELRAKWAEAVEAINTLLDAHEWDRAQREIERLRHALPNEPQVARLLETFHERKNARKSELVAQWESAVKRNDIDAGIRILTDLDQYLTREEASSLEETARHVFKAKLLQLGMQFQFAVREKRWRDAVEVGVQISEEFPNSRMAHEVEEAMGNLRKRAGLHGDVEIIAGRPRPA